MQPNNQNQPVKSVDGISAPHSSDSANAPSTPPPAAPPASPPTNNTGTPASAKPATSVIKSGNFKANNTALLTTLLIALLLIILVGGIYGVYNWQHKKVNSLSTQISSLNNQVQSLRQQNSSSNSASASSQYIFKIAPLGIQFTVPLILADLTTSVNSNDSMVNISSETLELLSNNCSPSVTTGSALGDIEKVDGTFKSSSASTVLIKQINSSYYFAYTRPVSVCSNDSAADSLISTLVSELENSFTSFETTPQ
jgi:outer membrane murein-binding lipoprotein Lpp